MQAGTVVMGTSFPTPYEAVVDKTKGLSVRTFMLANAVSPNLPEAPSSMQALPVDGVSCRRPVGLLCLARSDLWKQP